MSRAELDFELLGPLRVLRSGTALRLGGRQQRAVLACLLTSPNSPVSSDELADALWGGAHPSGHTSTLQTYVFHLRAALEPDRRRGAPSRVLPSEPGGYLLNLTGVTTDEDRFETGLARGEAALAAGHFADAASTLRDALGLWRGPVLADLADFAFVAPVAARLDELRRSAEESLVEAVMGQGGHAQAVADLDRLIAVSPLQERFHGQRMLALYRAGRQSDALQAYRDLRHLLAEEIGVEPTPEIRQLHQAILAQDPSLEWRPGSAATDGHAGHPLVLAEGPRAEPVVAPAPPSIPRTSRLVGRELEQHVLGQILDAAARGNPSALVVQGEAGVGKTRLVRDVCDQYPGHGGLVLWGSCVRFGEASVPFAPVTGALQSWLSHAGATERAEVLFGAEELGTLLPALGGDRTSEAGRLLPLIDLVVNRITERRPTVVVIDDLQWADVTSLDVLAYLVTGFHGQRLALLATCRDEHRGEGHPLHSWFADMRRTAHFGELHLDRLGLAATEAQIEGLRGAPADIEFAAGVQELTGGNPYLTELLVGQSGSAPPALPTTAPAALRDALLAKWHLLSTPTRRFTRVLAVGGRPPDLRVLTGVAARYGIDPGRMPGCLEEATEQGVVQTQPDGRPWFRHPLLAEVLYDDLPVGEAARIHADYVRMLADEAPTVQGRAADLALHNERAGRVDDAFRWSVHAADEAARLHASAEEAIHLERACALLAQVSPGIRGAAGRLELLRRAGHACRLAGRVDAALTLVNQALNRVSRDAQPLVASTLLRARSELSWERSTPPTAVDRDLNTAVELTAPFPRSPERAAALASLAMAEMWDQAPDAAEHADAAVAVAHASGSQGALSQALSTRAAVHVYEPESESLADADNAARLAKSTGDSWALGVASIWRVNRLWTLGRIGDAVLVADAAFDDVRLAGSEQWSYVLAAMAAAGMLFLGRWLECRRLLRTALAARCGGIPGGMLRLVAARLEARTGSVDQARQHLDRALELVSEDFAGLRGDLAFSGTEVLVAAGQPQKAFDWCRRRLERAGAWPATHDEQLLPPLATSAAEVADLARRAGDPVGAVHAATMLHGAVAGLPEPPFVTARPDSGIQAMEEALFRAELARCRDDTDQPDRWGRARTTCQAVSARWEEALSSLRQAQCLYAHGASPATVADPLRVASRFADEVGARPMQSQVQTLARDARVGVVDAHLRVPGAPYSSG